MTDHSDPGGVGHPDEARRTQHWAVTVSRDGTDLLTIASNGLSGKAEFSAEDEAVIRLAGEHLLAFIGRQPVPPPGAVPAAAQDEEEPFDDCERALAAIDSHIFSAMMCEGEGEDLRAAAVPAAQDAEEPFSEGFWAGRMSDRTAATADERLQAFAAYQAGERWNRGDGDMRRLQDRAAVPAAQDARPPTRGKWEDCRHQYWDLGWCCACGIHSNDPRYTEQSRQRAIASHPSRQEPPHEQATTAEVSDLHTRPSNPDHVARGSACSGVVRDLPEGDVAVGADEAAPATCQIAECVRHPVADAHPEEPQEQPMQTLPYERLDSEALQRAVLLQPGEHLLVLRPYGWHLDGHHIPNAAEHFSRAGVCEELRMVFVCDYGPYIAIVRAALPDDDVLESR